ncbi:concanavalin A-like lectin/glucanase domain-containing protein [Lasiosphaeria hispida]|uniref:Concanavalin A-like lectin/glucanase domain-containing protein n=1 Tax=Lasiosphaeria hispida TaxID=260671 RepID=A0AAJ0HF46_9PEZI|nr:concanavalin A-like lectin/glucanase domain-containing protein [Lasiosphaeria hispida]
MKLLSTAFLVSALVAQQALAELTFTVKATRNGKPVPASEIKLEPFQPSRNARTASNSRVPPPPANGKERRTNPSSYSSNWCGSVNHATALNPIKKIHAYFQHPTCTKRTGVATYPQAAAFWAGIDGDTYTSALLQSGTVCKIDNSTGIVRNEAWWQWYPSAAYTITSLPVAIDDWFEVTVEATTTTSGVITLENLTQSLIYTITITGGPTLGRVDADWVVERPTVGGSPAGFAHFTDVWFQDAYATRTTGSLGILGANQYQILNSCSSAEYDDSNEVSWVP